MTPEQFQRAKSIFQEALERGPDARAAFLDESCGADDELRREVESLLNLEGQPPLRHVIAETMPTVPDGSSTTAPSDEPRRIGAYEIVRELGHGGMGTVYLAVRSDQQFQKKVALKVIRRGMDTDFIVRRFMAERQILASLDHPNIARLYDGGTTQDGLPWFAMEYIEGENLLEYADRRKLPRRERVMLFRQVLAGVQYAHQSLVVHRDLKPSNILVTPDGTPRLLDFGLAKILQPESSPATVELTMTEQRMFTPEYASPEQVRGERITTASDIYSSGVLLYRLLIGRTPYRLTSRTFQEIAHAVVEQEPESSARALGSDLDNVLRMALRKDTSRRYVSADQLSEDLRRYLEGLPVAARSDTFAYRATKFVARHRLGVAAVALIFLALVGGIGATLWQARRAAQKELLAERRFNDVRKLANSYLFEVHDAIKNLAGSTPARELLVKRALEYLGQLARESGGDPALQREVAEAYMRVGDVQGGIGIANLGDAKGALESYLAALRIREKIAAVDPKSAVDRQALGEALQRVSDLQTGPEALNSIQKAVQLEEALIADEPRDLAFKMSLMSAYATLGQKLNLSDQPEQAVTAHRREVALGESIVAEDPKSFRARRGVAGGHYKIGQTLILMNKNADALESFQEATPLWEALIAENPTNAGLKRDLSLLLDDDSRALSALGRHDEAIEKGLHAIALREELATADPKDADIRLLLADAYSDVGAILAVGGRTGEGLAKMAKSVEMCLELARTDPENNMVPDVLYAAYENLGNAHRDLAKKAATSSLRGQEWRKAREWYTKERDLLLDLKSREKLEEVRAKNIEKASENIASCDKALGSPQR